MQFSQIHVTAIERNPDAVDLIKQNQAKFGLENIAVIEAYAPIELPEKKHSMLFSLVEVVGI